MRAQKEGPRPSEGNAHRLALNLLLVKGAAAADVEDGTPNHVDERAPNMKQGRHTGGATSQRPEVVNLHRVGQAHGVGVIAQLCQHILFDCRPDGLLRVQDLNTSGRPCHHVLSLRILGFAEGQVKAHR